MVASGVPSILAFTSAQETAEAIIARENFILSVPKAVSDCLGKMETAAFVVVDFNAGKLYATTDSATRTALLAQLTNPYGKLEMLPDTGQTGRFLAWKEGTKSNWSNLESETLRFSLAVKPRFSAYALAYEIARAVSRVWSPAPILTIDQVAGKVTAIMPTNAETWSANLGGVIGSGESVGIKLTPPAKPNFL